MALGTANTVAPARFMNARFTPVTVITVPAVRPCGTPVCKLTVVPPPASERALTATFTTPLPVGKPVSNVPSTFSRARFCAACPFTLLKLPPTTSLPTKPGCVRTRCWPSAKTAPSTVVRKLVSPLPAMGAASLSVIDSDATLVAPKRVAAVPAGLLRVRVATRTASVTVLSTSGTVKVSDTAFGGKISVPLAPR